MRYRPHLLATLAALCLLAACSSPKSSETAESKAPPAEPSKPEPIPEPVKKDEPPPAPVKKDEPPKAAKKVEPKGDPNVYNVRFTTTKGEFIVEVHRDWAPLGAERFHQLVKDRFFDGAGFFRVVPNFIIQFGLAADPAKTKKWDQTIKDDPVARTNGLGYLTFATAGPNTRTTQLFINLKSNQFLDGQGFAPFGRVTQGMEVVEKLNAEYKEAPDQGAITAQGNAYLKANFPRLDYVTRAVIF